MCICVLLWLFLFRSPLYSVRQLTAADDDDDDDSDYNTTRSALTHSLGVGSATRAVYKNTHTTHTLHLTWLPRWWTGNWLNVKYKFLFQPETLRFFLEFWRATFSLNIWIRKKKKIRVFLFDRNFFELFFFFVFRQMRCLPSLTERFECVLASCWVVFLTDTHRNLFLSIYSSNA